MAAITEKRVRVVHTIMPRPRGVAASGNTEKNDREDASAEERREPPPYQTRRMFVDAGGRRTPTLVALRKAESDIERLREQVETLQTQLENEKQTSEQVREHADLLQTVNKQQYLELVFLYEQAIPPVQQQQQPQQPPPYSLQRY